MHFAVSNSQISEGSVKSYLAPKLYYPFSDSRDDISQIVSADMRLSFCEDLFRRTEIHEAFKNISAKRVFYSCGELAVRKCACTAFTELHVAIGVKLACEPEFLYRCSTFFH